MDLQSLTLQKLQAVHQNIRLAANELGLSRISDTRLTKLVAPEATVDANGRYVLGGIPLGTVAWYKTEPVNTYGLGSGGGGGNVDLSGIQSQIDALQAASTKAARIEAVQALQAALDGNAVADATLKQQVDTLASSLGDVSATELKVSVDKLLADVSAMQEVNLDAEQQAAAAAAAAAKATAAAEAAKIEAARLEALARNLEQGSAENSDDYEF